MVHRVGIDLNIDDVIADYYQGMTQNELQNKYKVSEESLRRRMIEAGAKMRPRGQPHGKYLPNGGKTIDKDGYTLVKAPLDHPYKNNSGYIREHRLVMEQHIGRYLLPTEVVHHKEKNNKSNNDISNLVLYASHAEHFADEMRGNDFAVGRVGCGDRIYRTDEQIMEDIHNMSVELGRPLQRADFVPPHTSYKVLNRRFGNWRVAIELALGQPQPQGHSPEPNRSESEGDARQLPQ